MSDEVRYLQLNKDWGMLSDAHLKDKFDRSFPELSKVVGIAGRGQQWSWRLPAAKGVTS